MVRKENQMISPSGAEEGRLHIQARRGSERGAGSRPYILDPSGNHHSFARLLRRGVRSETRRTGSK